MRTCLSVLFGLLVAPRAWGTSPNDYEPEPCDSPPGPPPEFMPADGAAGLPTNLERAFVRWPAGECDFDVRLFIGDEEVEVSSIGYMDESVLEYNHQAWRSIRLQAHAEPGQRFRIELHPRAQEGFTKPPFISYFEMGDRADAPPDPASAELSGNEVGEGRRGRAFSLGGTWPEVAGTPYGYVRLRKEGEVRTLVEDPIVLLEADGKLSYTDPVRVPAFGKVCYSAQVIPNLVSLDGSDNPTSEKDFCVRRSACAAAPAAGLAPTILALLALVARRSRGGLRARNSGHPPRHKPHSRGVVHF